MRNLIFTVLLAFAPTLAPAQDSIPALKGTWHGVGKILLYGSTEHLSGSPNTAVVRDLDVTHTVEGHHHISRSNRKVLRAERRESAAGDRSDLLYDGPGETLIL